MCIRRNHYHYDPYDDNYNPWTDDNYHDCHYDDNFYKHHDDCPVRQLS